MNTTAARDVTADLVSPESDAARTSADDLGARILSAIALIPLALGAAYAGGPWLAAAAGGAIVAMTYEWARMSEPGALSAAWALGLIAALGGVMLASHAFFFWAFGWVCAWAVASALRRRSLSGAAETAFGALYVGAPCVAFLWLRAQGEYGLSYIITLFVIIWSADVAAYFSGRLLRGPLLWPALSPQKTWAGIGGGLTAGAVAGAGLALAFRGPGPPWIGAGVALAACGLGGDLFESALKRRFGVKDASRLIPGHGGVLDRLDGMIVATCVASLTLALAPALAPALFGRPL
jgi:phosphatidate cytidylyltransferase